MINGYRLKFLNLVRSAYAVHDATDDLFQQNFDDNKVFL